MVEVFGDMFQLAETGDYNYVCISTNGFVKKNGEAVMGRGNAYQFNLRYLNARKKLGELIRMKGNNVNTLQDTANFTYLTFPVKHNWYEQADIELIKRSCMQVKALLKENDKVLLPRPGCGNGGLKWCEIKPLLEDILDDRFHIVSWK